MGFTFAYGSSVISLIVVSFMPKHLSRKEIYITWGWVSALTLFTDVSFGIILDLYDFVEPDVNFIDLPLQAILAPSIAVIFLNFMPREIIRFIFFVIGVVLFSIVYEWLCTLTGYLIYKGWRLEYSIPFYLFGILFLRWHLYFLRKSG